MTRGNVMLAGLVAVLASGPARADDEADVAGEVAAVPDVVYAVSSNDAVEIGTVRGLDVEGRAVAMRHEGALDRLEVAFGAGGRFALLTETDAVAGKTVKRKDGTVAIGFGTLARGLATLIPGDQTCVAIDCFEIAPRLSADGRSLWVAAASKRGLWVNRYRTGKRGKPSVLVRRLSMEVPDLGADGERATIVATGGEVFVEKLPVGKKRRAAVTGRHVIAATRLGERVVVIRTDPETWERHTLELIDLVTGDARVLHTLASGASRPLVGMVHDAGRDQLYVVDAADYGPASAGPVLAFDLATAGDPRTVAADVRRVLDVSADGAHLVAVTAAPDGAAYDDRLVVIDVATGAITPLAIPGATRVVAAGFAP